MARAIDAERLSNDLKAYRQQYFGYGWHNEYAVLGQCLSLIDAQPTLTPPNEPLTQADIDKMHFDRVWIDYGLDDSGERCGEDGVILYGKLYSIDTLDGSAFEDLLLDACDGETLGRPSGDYTVYRRPPEVQS